MFEKPSVQTFIAQASKQSYRPRQLIVRGGQKNSLFLVLEGSVTLILEHGSGEQAVLGHLHAGDFFGERVLRTPAVEGGIAVRARDNTIVAALHAEDLARLIAQQPGIALELISQLASRLDDSYHRIADHFFLDVSQRLGRTLGRLSKEPDANPCDGGIAIRVNRQELALMIGCSREMIARGLKSLEASGAISVDGHTVVVRTDLQRAPGEQPVIRSAG